LKDIPFFIKENSWLAKIAAKKLHTKTVAMVLGSTIHLYNCSKEDFLNNERWLNHELCHIRQFTQHGNFLFTIKYLYESIKVGYYNNKYEIEARAAENQPTAV